MKKKLSEYTTDILPAQEQPPAKVAVSGLPRGFKEVNGSDVTVDMDFVKEQTIFFATPCYGGMITDQYFLSMFKMSQVLMKYGVSFRVTTLRNESLISRARNTLTAMFLEDESCTHLMFIDADIEFEPDSIIRLIAMDKDIIAGAYPKKTIDWNSVKRAVERGDEDIENYTADYALNFKFYKSEDGSKRIKTHAGAVEVLDASTGFFLIKREVIERMVEEYPELYYKNDSAIDPKYNKYCYALWDTMIDPDDLRYLSEDYTFCRRAQRMGIEVWLDPNTNLNHVGSYTFQGNINKVLSRARKKE